MLVLLLDHATRVNLTVSFDTWAALDVAAMV